MVESKVREPMVPLGLFRDSRFTVSCGVYAIMYLALASTFFFVTLFFQNVEGWSALERRAVLVDHEYAVPHRINACRSARGVDRFGHLLARRPARRARRPRAWRS